MKVKVKFEFYKYTPRKVSFKEVLNDPLDTEKIGTQYISKETIKEMGWKEGQPIYVTIELG